MSGVNILPRGTWASAVAHCVGLPHYGVADPGLRRLALGYMLSPTSWACVAGSMPTLGFADSPWATCCRHLRGLASLLLCGPRASRTRPGLHAVAHFVGLHRSCVAMLLRSDPGLRGLALGYMLSPTSWACVADSIRDPGLRGLALGYMLSPTSWASALMEFNS